MTTEKYVNYTLKNVKFSGTNAVNAELLKHFKQVAAEKLTKLYSQG